MAREADLKTTSYPNQRAGAFCYYISGQSNSGQFQMLSCKAAQGSDLP